MPATSTIYSITNNAQLPKKPQIPFQFQFMSLYLVIVTQFLAFFFFFNMFFKIVVGVRRVAGSESLPFCLVMALEIVLERSKGKTKA